MKTNIPTYRAKNINGVESHIGLLKWNKNKTKFWINDFENGSQEIDPSTLAIHFPDMLDSDGTKIFASLSEDGKGGDKWDYIDHDCDTMRHIVVFDKETLAVGLIDAIDKDWQEFLFDVTDDFKARSKVTGIQQ